MTRLEAISREPLAVSTADDCYKSPLDLTTDSWCNSGIINWGSCTYSYVVV